MDVTFRNRAEEACYGIAHVWLKRTFGDAAEPHSEPLGFLTRIGNVDVLTVIQTWNNSFGEDDAIIRNMAYIVRGVEPTLLLTRFLVEKNAEVLFGGFALNEDGDVFFSHSLAGSTCDRLELEASVSAVAQSAVEFHGEVLSRAPGAKSALSGDSS